MTLFRRQESQDGRNSMLVVELTNGQFVIMISVALFVAAVCFGAGILSARVEHSAQQTASLSSSPAEISQPATQETPPTAPVETGPTQTYKIAAADAGTSKPTATPPPPSNPVPATAESTPSPAPAQPVSPSTAPAPVQEAAPAAEPQQQVITVTPAIPPAPKPSPLETGTKPHLTELPPLPSQPSVVETPPVAEKPAGLVPIIPADPPVETTPQSHSEKPALANIPPEPAATPATVSKDKKKNGSTPPTDVSAAEPAKTGKFVVQLGLFSGADRKANAEDLRKRMKKEFAITTQTIESDSVIRVVIGGFPDKNAASTTCTDIRKKPGLSEAFVRPL